MTGQTRPRDITIERAAGTLRIEWSDGAMSTFPLRWLRANCPCATCREERRTAALETDLWKLSSGPLPSAEITGAELVGNYAIRLTWADGHATGIYAFSILREAAEAAAHDPGKLPALLPD